MRIAVIGTGNVGSTLGRRWAQGGHQVIYGSREPDSPRIKKLVQDSGPNAAAAISSQAAGEAEVVVLATPWDATHAAVKAAGDLRGKIVVDCTNPLSGTSRGLGAGQPSSAGELVAQWAPGASVVKAFNMTGAGNMADPAYGDTAATMFVCGDNTQARAVVSGLAAELGFDVVDAGPLMAARYLEPLAMLWVHLAYSQAMGPNIAFKLLKRT
jgi:NADPH-dependent F420 reductase